MKEKKSAEEILYPFISLALSVMIIVLFILAIALPERIAYFSAVIFFLAILLNILMAVYKIVTRKKIAAVFILAAIAFSVLLFFIWGRF